MSIALLVPYDPDWDNCAGSPGCGDERVFLKWFGIEHFMCPRCYVNVFGGEPDPSSVRNITSGLSFECGTGCHAPLCPGRNCSCDCHRREG